MFYFLIDKGKKWRNTVKKRALALVLAGTMVFGLTACNKVGSNDTTTAAGETTTVAGETTSDTSTAETTQAQPVAQTTEVADYSEYLTLGDYKNLDIEVDAAVVTDEQIQNRKDQIVSYYNTNILEGEHITEGTTADGDVINLDYSGLLDGTAFDGGTATSQKYTVGSGRFISDLDEQLAGLEVGKEYELKCTFPEDYSNNTDLAGKEVTFVVTVNWIEGDKDELEWGDELVNAYTNGSYTSADEYEKAFTEEMLADAQSSQQTNYENGLWTKITENSTFNSLPEEKVSGIADDYYNYYVQYFTYYASLYGMDMASFLSGMYNMTTDDLTTECRSMAENEVKYIMLACEIYKDLGMTLSDEEYNTRAQETAAENNFDSAQAFIEQYGEEYVRESFIFDIVSEYLKENNNMVINE